MKLALLLGRRLRLGANGVRCVGESDNAAAQFRKTNLCFRYRRQCVNIWGVRVGRQGAADGQRSVSLGD